MKAIDKAWNENLKLSKEYQYESKEAIMGDRCPIDTSRNTFSIKLKTPKYCTDGEDYEYCKRCWNREVEDNNKNNDNSTFEQLEHSPVEFCIKTSTEEYLIEDLRDNEPILYMRQDEELKYEQIPIIIKWLQDVYNYCTELKNKV